jgi:hypothetical protein
MVCGRDLREVDCFANQHVAVARRAAKPRLEPTTDRLCGAQETVFEDQPAHDLQATAATEKTPNEGACGVMRMANKTLRSTHPKRKPAFASAPSASAAALTYARKRRLHRGTLVGRRDLSHGQAGKRAASAKL